MKMNISQNVSQNGLLGGCAAVLYLLLLYVLNVQLLVHPLWSSVPLLIILPTFMTLSAIHDRNDNDGYIKMEEAFKSAFFTAALALFLLVAFNYILRAAIDPRLVAIEKEASIELSIKMMESFGADEEAIETTIEELEKTDVTPRLGTTLSGYIIYLAFGAIPAVIIAAFVRRLPPLGNQPKMD